MTKDKAAKQAIRARMTKTGERYTTAQRHLRNQRQDAPSPEGDAAAAADAATPSRPANLGMSDDAILRGTGKRWDEWILILDDWQAATRPHPEIAHYVGTEHDVNGWWAQTVTVGYERARGLRAVHQRPDGYSVSVSKTFPVAIDRLYAAFVDESIRDAWLEPGSLALRTARPDRSARFDVRATDTRLAVTFIEKGDAKATAQLQHERLDTADDVETWRDFWKARLARLGATLT